MPTNNAESTFDAAVETLSLGLTIPSSVATCPKTSDMISGASMLNGTSRLRNQDDLVWTAILSVLVVMWMLVFYRSIRGDFLYSWAYTDLLINWSAGFVRRGLYGTLVLLFHSFTGATGADVLLLTSIIFIFLTIIQIGILFYLLRQFKHNYILLVLVGLSPTMLLFAVYDTAAYWRKESFLNAAILIHALIARQYLTNKVSFLLYEKLFICFIVPLLIINILIYEPQALFVPFHIAITSSIYRVSDSINSKSSAKQLFIFGYFILLVPFIASVLAHGDEQTSSIIFDSVKSWAGIVDQGAIMAQGWTLARSHSHAEAIISDPLSVLTYLWAFLFGPVMLCIAIRSQCNSRYDSGISVWPFIPPLALFFIGWDWGRWINMIAIHGVAYMLHIPCQPSSDESTWNSAGRSHHQWFLFFLLISFVTLYTVGWSLPRCKPYPDLVGGQTFLAVWFQIYDDVQRIVFDLL